MDSYAYDYGGYAAADASATATTVGVGAAAAACCFQIVFVALVVGCCFRRTASPVVRQLLGDEENPTAPVIRDQNPKGNPLTRRIEHCGLLDSVGIWLARTRRAVSQHSALESDCADRIA